MYVLRLLAVLAAISIVVCLGAWMFTGDLRYRNLAMKIFRFTLMAVLGVFALLILERVAIIPA